MNYLVNARTMKAVDEYSINTVKLPSLVLMERAAYCVAKSIITDIKNRKLELNLVKVCVVCGSGNNGADGIAVARQLNEKNIAVCIVFVSENAGTEEFRLQKEIASHLGITIKGAGIFDFNEYNYIVDAIFGIGLSREVSGIYADAVENINAYRKEKTLIERRVVSVDIPSGVCADTGKVLGCAVKADWTVTFGYNKIGCMLYPGASFCGNVYVEDAGFAPLESLPHRDEIKKTFTYDESDLMRLPERTSDSNKGTYGKALIIAGSKEMGGAAILSALGCNMCGTGLVKVISHISNKDSLLNNVPGCLISVYDDEVSEKDIVNSCEWAGCIVCGPGLTTNENAAGIVNTVIKMTGKTRIFDADALNIIARDKLFVDSSSKPYIVTPHIGEMSRLTGLKIDEIKASPIEVAKKFANNNRCICVLKDARTVVTDGDRVFINSAGNDGMSTGGSGDVLAGIMAGLAATGMEAFEAACLAVYSHALAGDIAAKELGKRALTSKDIAKNVGKLFK